MGKLHGGIKSWIDRRKLGRRKLGKLLRKPCDLSLPVQTQRTFEDCLIILRRNPKLAGERFLHCYRTSKMEIFPLAFFLLQTASLDIIQEVHQMYPDAACQRITKHWFNGRALYNPLDYPLHVACGYRNAFAEGVVLYLAQAFPAAAAMKSQSGSLPLHALLRHPGRTFTYKEVKTLLDHYLKERRSLGVQNSTFGEKGDWREGNNDYGAMLSLAMRTNDIDPSILDLLVQSFPSGCDEFYLGRLPFDTSISFFLQQPTRYTMTASKLESLSQLLPRLRVFSCTTQYWSGDAFFAFLHEMRRNKSLQHLTIAIPSSVLLSEGDNDDNLSLALLQIAAENATLQHLHLDFRAVSTASSEPTVARRAATCLLGFVNGMRHNKTLQECRYTWLPTMDTIAIEEKSFAALANILQQHNTVLQNVWISSSYHYDNVSRHVEKVEYWAALNRSGRAKVRDPSLRFGELVALLVAANDESAQRNPAEPLEILFGLLLESSGLWSRVQ